MHSQNLENMKHLHSYRNDYGKNKSLINRVVVITFIAMAGEISAGIIFGSMALLADGIHMATHALALGISSIAYYIAQKNQTNPKFSFGTGKVVELGGYSSSIVLIIAAFFMIFESASRLLNPQTIQFNEAIIVAVTGLVINLVCAVILQKGSNHSHSHDNNLKAAYLHVIADALTSILAIGALIAGKLFNWIWLDAVIGIVGAIIILRWGIGLLKETGKILLDNISDEKMLNEIKSVIESDKDNRITDLHVWKIGPNYFSCVISLFTHYPENPEYYKNLLINFKELSHITIEVNKAKGKPCIKVSG